jgi:hypothetical protein
MADRWNARSWVASVLGCSQADLSIRSRRDDYMTGTQVRYDRVGEQVARLIVAGPVRPLDGKPEGHWVIAVELADGSTREPTTDIPESIIIEY